MKKILSALVLVTSAVLAGFAHAQAPGIQQVQTVNITPPATATPPQPVVGQNVDTTQTQTQTPTPPPATPAPAPSATSDQTTAPSEALPPGFPAAKQKNEKREERFIPSEVVTALPPIAKAQEIRAVLRTSLGDITLKLDRLNAPLTVAHFVALVRGDKESIDVKTSKPVKRPFYNGLTFHRVLKGTLIQTGDPFGNGRGDAGPAAGVPDENKPNMKFNRPGLVAMAPMRDESGKNLVKNSNSSQFFITLREMHDWDGQFTIFAEVEDGLDVVQKIANSKVGPTDRPIKRVYLVAVEIIESN